MILCLCPHAGQTIRTRLSYCDPLKRNHRKCRIGEVAVTMRGVGPVVLDVVGGVRCTCNQPLSIKKTRPDGLFSIQYYACGKVIQNKRRARFAGQDIPRYTEHRTALPEPNRVSDRCGRTLDWVSEALFGLLTGICRLVRLNYCVEFRDYFGVPRDIPTMRIERA